MSARVTRCLTVFDGEQYEDGFPPSGFVGFMEWVQAKMSEIPSEHRHTAVIDLSPSGGYEGDSYANINISYARPETDEEMEVREKVDRRLASEMEEGEKRQLAKLRAKYPD